MEWQRRWIRVEEPGLVSLMVVQTSKRMQATVEDVSAGGMCLGIPRPLARGDQVVVRSARGNRSAVVRRCELRRSDATYLIGIEFQTGAE